MSTRQLSFLIFLFCLMPGKQAFSQATDASNPDTGNTKTDFVSKMQLFAKASAKKSKDEFASDKAAIAQNKIFEEVKRTMQKSKIFLKTGLDTVEIKTQLATIEKHFLTAGDGVITHKGTAQTFRNLTTTAKILTELLNKTNVRKSKLDRDQSQLNQYRYELDSLLSRPELFKFPTDSITLSKYLQQIVVLAYEVTPIDSALKKAALNIQGRLNQVNMQAFKIHSSLEEIEYEQRKVAENTLSRDFENLWGKVGFHRPFKDILSQAGNKGILNLLFYLQNNSGKIFILIILISASFIYLRSLRQIYINHGLISHQYEGQLVLKYPLCSALLIVISVFQFIFFSPPFILNFIFWIISALSLTLMFRGFITKYWMNVWILMVSLFFFSAADNLILQASRIERWLMLALSVTGSVAGAIILLKGKKEELREKLILIAIGLMIFLEIASVFTNIYGRYNLSKALLISGYLNVVVAILFLWSIRLINEGLFLAFNVYTRQDPKLFYLNFEKVGKKAPLGFYLLMIFGWIILFGRNFAGFEYASAPIRDFFAMERTIGDYTFSINSLLLFILIMGISVITSKIVSFFASDKHAQQDEKNRSALQSVGSWLLLIRIAILSLGLFLAVAAAGIPMDRITIVLGALGVGIGFGLQALVNNLVSGLILAFEKPVNVGDIIEIDGQSGTMKSIGFRSSVISTWEGADVIMPNGDILNSHLVNWSLSGNKRRLFISIGISYDSNLKETKEVLMSVLEEESDIMKNPAPVVHFEKFGESSIDIKILFWNKHYKDGSKTKSDLIEAIDAAFRAKGIKIPFPHQDITINRIDKQ
ncbi:mechanosensitive ion channel domain-containing protein [Pedobacter sp. N23S346]|uniref:mechanosensitive ion channel domain-containing protein n=1 Tax=Pedobacter sp. N23S346 TaxID=3402750 RepID=UPI003ABEF08F